MEQLLTDAGHRIIYTPPFCPEVQPIELLWATVKRKVAERATLHRSMTDTREQTEEAFESVTKMQCNDIVKHCHDWMDGWLSSDAAGDLQQFRTLAGVIKHLSLIKATPDSSQPRCDDSAPMQLCSPPPAAAASAASTARVLRKRR